MLELDRKKKGTRVFSAVIKRSFDVTVSALALILLSPLFFWIAWGIRLTSPGPILFAQVRMGRLLTPFVLYKFRTMSCRAPHDAPTREVAGAAYITRFGAFLRRTSLDELPQFFNILRGDMSLIGPRPVVLTEHELIARRMLSGVYRVRPGLSGLAQILGRDLLSPREKTALDRLYVRHIAPSFDLRLLLLSVRPVMTGRFVQEGEGETAKKGENNVRTGIQ